MRILRTYTTRLWAGLCLALASLLAVLPVAAQKGAPRGEWHAYHGDLGATQYSDLDQITADNVSDLEVAWTWESPDNAVVDPEGDRRLAPGPYKTTPLAIGGRLFVDTPMGHVAAIDAKTGETLWVFDTKSREAGRPTNVGFNSRAVGYWTDGVEERLFEPTGDASLWAIDAKTGTPIESFGEGGRVDLVATLRREVDRRRYSTVSAPLVVGNVVIVGSSISDGPTHKEAPPGDVQAFDVRTGKLVWTFHNPPVAGESGYETWEDGSAEYTGNANIWTNLSADPELGLIYLPFGTPTNDWYGGHRKGDNLFAESIVCLKAATGELVWHHQLIHHGLWDYDIPAAPTLFDTVIDGKPVKGVAVVTKQAFTYVFDRVTGKPIWPIEERPVGSSDVPGEKASPTQPFPTKPPAFDYQGISDDVLIDFTPELKAEAKEILKKYRTGPIYTPPVLISDTVAGTIQLPGWGGGATWWGAAVDVDTGYLYIPSRTFPIVVGLVEPDAARSNFRYIRGRSAGYGRFGGPRGLPLTKPPYGRVTAIDLKTGEIAWQVPHGDGIRQQIIDMGIDDPGPVGGPASTGPLLTKTLLFIAQGSLTLRGGGGGAESSVLRAFDKKTGAVISEKTLEQAPAGTPMTYLADGKQFIVLAVGGRDKAGLVALSLP